MTREEWFKLPLKLRQRWWRETNFGADLPSADLQEALRCVLEKKNDLSSSND